jgi:hypothetical protein
MPKCHDLFRFWNPKASFPAEGMKHLRDLNLVHRDLKPGNIMKFLAPDGSIIYKVGGLLQGRLI